MSSAASSKKIAIFGAGITGLAAARELIRRGHKVTVYEASPHVGGLAATFKDKEGFTYDNGPRFIFSTLAEKIGILDECVPVKYYEHMRIDGRDYQFPFGFSKNPFFVLSLGSAFITRYFQRKPRSLRDFLSTYYGRYFSGKALAPLIEKWSGVRSADMSVDFASRLLPTNLSYIIYSVIKKLRGGVTEDFYKKGRYIVYPQTSNARIFEALLQTPGLTVHLNAPLKKIDVQNQHIEACHVEGHGAIEADYYLSTIPISTLSRLTAPHLDRYESLSYRSIVILFIKLARPRVLEGLWTWFPESKYTFYRIAEYKNAIASLAPKDKTLISVEFACAKDDAIWTKSKEELLESIKPELQELYGINSSEVIGLDIHHSDHAYPVLAKSTESIHRHMEHQTPIDNLFIAGRTGMFQYRMTEGCYDSAMSCVSEITENMAGRTTLSSRTLERDAYGRPLVIHE